MPIHILMEMNIMKFYSEITEKLYDTPEELQAEEEKFHAECAAAEERTMKYIIREKEVNDAIDNARKLLNEFVRDYGKFRLNKKNEDNDDWNAFFKLFF